MERERERERGAESERERKKQRTPPPPPELLPSSPRSEAGRRKGKELLAKSSGEHTTHETHELSSQYMECYTHMKHYTYMNFTS